MDRSGRERERGRERVKEREGAAAAAAKEEEGGGVLKSRRKRRRRRRKEVRLRPLERSARSPGYFVVVFFSLSICPVESVEYNSPLQVNNEYTRVNLGTQSKLIFLPSIKLYKSYTIF
jgi:hypothetical protein